LPFFQACGTIPGLKLMFNNVFATGPSFLNMSFVTPRVPCDCLCLKLWMVVSNSFSVKLLVRGFTEAVAEPMSSSISAVTSCFLTGLTLGWLTLAKISRKMFAAFLPVGVLPLTRIAVS
jgi:hypothetical protein